MNELNKLKVEKLIDNPDKCFVWKLVREYFQYDVKMQCPYERMTIAYFRKFIRDEESSKLWKDTIDDMDDHKCRGCK